MAHFLVIGMNSFGRNLARDLLARGHEVVVVDRDVDRINRIRYDVPDAVRFDATDRDALEAFDVKRFDHVVVCMGHLFEAAERATLALIDVGARAVTNLATTRGRRDILRAIGADRVVAPGLDLARNLAVVLSEKEIISFVYLDRSQGIAELALSRHLNLTREWPELLGPGTRTIGIRRAGRRDEETPIECSELTGVVLEAGDRIVAFGPPELIAERARKLGL
ncbi:MAG: TrkA family potassium uptake protein [Planctomycetes bacterium]|nr:TrkA family potassium uptake protein [Planctomycetota bacterium]